MMGRPGGGTRRRTEQAVRGAPVYRIVGEKRMRGRLELEMHARTGRMRDVCGVGERARGAQTRAGVA